jgi:hypothetical protein
MPKCPHGDYYIIPNALADEKYKGCGNGQIVVAEDGTVVDMDYLDEADWIIKEQNIVLHDDAGEVLGVTEEGHTIYRVNFSCGSACLF